MMSCTPDDEFTRSNGQMGLLGFSVGISDDNESSATRSESYVVDTFVLDGDTLSLVCTVTDMDAPAPEAEETSDTRGVPIYTRPETASTSARFNLESVYGRFNLSGYIVDDDNDELDPFFFNKTSADGKSTIMGTNTATDTYVNIPYKYESYETVDSKRTKWEFWQPVDANATDSKTAQFFWWRDKVNAENDYKLQFFAYSPTPDVTAPYKWTPVNMQHTYDTTEGEGITTFDYTVPKAVSGYSNRDAEVQPDILVGITEPLKRDDLETVTISGEEHYFVPLTFYHALCGVRFKATEELTKKEYGLKINSITLTGLKNAGTCTFKRKGNASGNNKSCDKISWTYETANSGTYTQTFGYTVPETSDFADDKTEKDATIFGAEEGAGANKNFMLIPQDYGTDTGHSTSASPDAKIKINFTFEGKTETKESTFKGYYKWEAGKLYTYSIEKVADIVDVEIDETVNSPLTTKEDVFVKNTGNVNGYIRAAVIANWVKKDGSGNEIVVAPLDFTDASQCDFSGFQTTYWKKGTDGFYYYYKVVKPDEETDYALFESLEAGTSPADPDNAYLKVVIVAQGLRAKNATDQTDAATTWSVDGTYIPEYTNIE